MTFKINAEAKTGAVVLAALIVLGAVLLKVGHFTWFQRGFAIRAQFHFTSGVKKHAPVRLSGVDVGEVKDIRFIYGEETLIELVLWIREGTLIRSDSRAYVATLGLMGEKYVEIKSGSPAAPYAKEDELISSEEPVRLEDLVAVGTDVAKNVSNMSKDIGRLASHADSALTDNRPKLDAIFDNLEETSDNFREFSQDIKYHPWKVLLKGKEKNREEIEKERQKRGANGK